MNPNAPKVVHFSSVHKATDTRIFVKECRSVRAAGYDVTLIARAECDEVIDGVKIISVKDESGSRLRRMTATVLDVYRKASRANGDLYQFHDPELLPVGVVLKLRGKRVIYDVHEDVPDQIQSKYWIPSVLRYPISKAVGIVEQRCARLLDGVVAATPKIASHFPSSKTVIAQNFPVLYEVPEVQRLAGQPELEQRVIYTGALSELRGAYEMVQVMNLLGPQGVRLTIAGVIRPRELEKRLSDSPGWQYVDYVGWQSRAAVIQLMESARVGLVLFHPAPNHAESQPNKLFEYMGAGLPVVGSDFPFWNQFIGGIGSGLMVNPHNIVEIADAIKWLLRNPVEAEEMGARGRRAVQEQYNWELEEGKLLRLYERLLNSSTSTRTE